MHAQHYIGGSTRAGATDATIPVIDPATGQSFGTLARGTATEIDWAVQAAQGAMGACFDGPWGGMPAFERGRLLAKLSAAVLAEHEALAQIEARDTGKTLNVARNDVKALARYLEYYAGACDKLHGETLPFDRGFTVMTVRVAHGVTAHIIPWNYPLQISGQCLRGQARRRRKLVAVASG